MIIINFETGETGTILTAFNLYQILVYEVLNLDIEDRTVDDFREKIESTFKQSNVDASFDSLEGIRFTFASVASEFLGLSIQESDKVYEIFLKIVEKMEGNQTIESVDNCMTYEIVRKACSWGFIDRKQIS